MGRAGLVLAVIALALPLAPAAEDDPAVAVVRAIRAATLRVAEYADCLVDARRLAEAHRLAEVVALLSELESRFRPGSEAPSAPVAALRPKGEEEALAAAAAALGAVRSAIRALPAATADGPGLAAALDRLALEERALAARLELLRLNGADAPPPVLPPRPGEVPATRAEVPEGSGVPAVFSLRRRDADHPPGATKGAEAAVGLALAWLANHQDPDGRWDGAGFMKHDKVYPVCDGAAAAGHDTGLTALALLAFLGAGETSRHGAHRDRVRAGLGWLRSVQDGDGCFGPREGKFTYGHAMATIAVAEAYALTGSPLLAPFAQRGVDFVHRCQNPYLAWRYGVRPQDNDTSVSGWMTLALFTARVAGLRVDDAGFDGMRAWLAKVTDPESGRAGYLRRGDTAAPRSEALTALGVVCRLLTGEDPRESPDLARGTRLVLRCPPVWDPGAGAVDMCYWFFGALAVRQAGGDGAEAWLDALRRAIVDHQRRDPVSFKGSFDPVDPHGPVGGRVYSTSMTTLALLAPCRYAPLVSARSRR